MARPFSSDLSVAEAFVVREAGFPPITQVMGSCFYQRGLAELRRGGGCGWARRIAGAQRARRSSSRQQTAAWNEARRSRSAACARRPWPRAPTRSSACACARRHRDWAAGLIEFVVIGTAVRSERFEIEDAPVLSHLSGQDFAKLVRHGFWPVGLVAGSTVAYVVAGSGSRRARRACSPGARTRSCPTSRAASTTRARWPWTRVTREAHAPARPRRRRRHDRAHASRRATATRRHELHRPDHRDARARHRDRRGRATTRRRRRRTSPYQLKTEEVP